MIGAASEPDAGGDVEFPVGAEIQVDGGENGLLLIVERVEAGDGPERAIIFKTETNPFCDVVTHFDVGREGYSLAYFETVEGTVHGGIEGHVPAAELFIHDGADFP